MTKSLQVWGVGTTRTMRVHWMMHELDLEYETRRIESRSGETQEAEYTAINPKQKIPCLVHGDIVITESFAIIKHLRDFTDQLPYDDYQKSSAGQAKYHEWLSFILMELDATSLYVVRRHKDLPGIYGEAPAAVDSSIEYFKRMLNSVIDEVPSAGFIWGSTFSEIDVLMTISLTWASVLKLPLPGDAQAYLEKMHSRPAYRAAFDHNFRDLKIPTIPPRN